MNVLKTGQIQVTLPFGWTELYGQPYNHTGIDIVKYYNELDTIVAAQKGKVVAVRKDATGFESGSYGNYVKIQHGNGYETLYAHLAYGSIGVNVGDIVEAGQDIGYMGATGNAYGAHLHFEVRINGGVVNPQPYLDGVENIPPYDPQPQPVAPSDWVDYTVQPGDTLNAIAAQRGTTAEEIQRYNPIIQDINLIVIGWVIKVPPMNPDQPVSINIGDDVIVNGIGYAASDGSGSQTKYRTEEKMKVVMIVPGAPYPYGCNQNRDMNGVTAFWADVRKA